MSEKYMLQGITLSNSKKFTLANFIILWSVFPSRGGSHLKHSTLKSDKGVKVIYESVNILFLVLF